MEEAGTRVDQLLAQAEAEWRSGAVNDAVGRYDSALEIVRAEPALAEREGVICLGKGFALMHDAGMHGSDGSMYVDRVHEDEKRWAEAVECLLRAKFLADAESGHPGGAQAAFIGPMLEEARRRHEAVKERLRDTVAKTRGTAWSADDTNHEAVATDKMEAVAVSRTDMKAETLEVAPNGTMIARGDGSSTTHAGADALADADADNDADSDADAFGGHAAEAVMRQALAMAVTRRAPVVAIVAVTAVTSNIESELGENEADENKAQQRPQREHNKLTLAPSSLRLVQHLRAGGIRFDAFNAADGGMDVTFAALAATRERWWQKAMVAHEAEATQEPESVLDEIPGSGQAAAQEPAASTLPQLWVGGSLLLAGSRGAVQFSGPADGGTTNVRSSGTIDLDSHPVRILIQRALAELAVAESDAGEEKRCTSTSANSSMTEHDPNLTLRTVFPDQVLATVFEDTESIQRTAQQQTDSKVQGMNSNSSMDSDQSSGMKRTAALQASPIAQSLNSHTAEIEGVVRDVLKREAAVVLASLLDELKQEAGPSDSLADLDSSLAFSQCISPSLSSTTPLLQCMQQDLERLFIVTEPHCSETTFLPSKVRNAVSSFEAGFVRELSARLGGFHLPAGLLQGCPPEETDNRHVDTQNQTHENGAVDDARRSIDDVVFYIEQHCPADGICGACPSRHTCSVHSGGSGDASVHGGSCHGKASQASQKARGWIDVADIEGLGMT